MGKRPLALVTGSSRGIGRGIARELGEAGLDVAVHYARQQAAAEQVAEGLRELGVEAETFQADLARADHRSRLVAEVLDRFGRLDLLVNNAGIAPRVRADVLEASEEHFREVMETNLVGPYFLTQCAAREMLRLHREGVVASPRIVFVTSTSAQMVSTNRGEYCVSKAGLSMAARVWAARLAQEGVVVLEIRPGIIATEMTAGVKEKYDRLIAQGVVPQGRWGTPADVARVVRAVAEGRLDFSAGAVITVDGGLAIGRL